MPSYVNSGVDGHNKSETSLDKSAHGDGDTGDTNRVSLQFGCRVGVHTHSERECGYNKKVVVTGSTSEGGERVLSETQLVCVWVVFAEVSVGG